MDQVHLPDPVLNDIRELQQENIRLHSELSRLIEEVKKAGNGTDDMNSTDRKEMTEG